MEFQIKTLFYKKPWHIHVLNLRVLLFVRVNTLLNVRFFGRAASHLKALDTFGNYSK